MDICGNPAIYIPITQCDECDSMLDRIRALEDKLAGKENILIAMTDTAGVTVEATVLGTAEESANG